ncbi:serine hydrolase domain-containing protein [Variovorax sp. GB1P17]|uniref:serine hydrolase domain-containing protein n=1 Tax=Variovorax sp. GB1P17 TaxID=3443740 RepID=UPI003F49651E
MHEPIPTSGLAVIDAIDALLQPFNRSDAPGLVIGIAQNGRSLYRRGIGMASLEQGVANTPRTRMRIASTSKHFTALAVLLLAEDGRLDIDDAVQKHLPELPQLGANGPTLRQLMNHTGGWRGHDELWCIVNGLAFQPRGLGLPAMVRQGELNFEPGTRMVYSNGAYFMLAKIIERVSGQGFDAFMKARIFEPMGMADTESVASDLDVRAGLAGLYVPASGGQWQRGIYPCELEGGGSLVSTLDDMLRWLAHLRSSDKTVGSASSWAQMLAPTTLSSGAVVPYGLGLFRHAYRGVEVIHHAGGVIGGTSQMLTVPAHGLDIMVMANGAAISPPALAYQLIDLLLADALSEPPEERTSASAFPALVGQRYHAPATGSVIGFADVAGKLGLSWQGFTALPLRQRKEDLWLAAQDLAINALELDVSGGDATRAPDTLVLREGGHLQRFERLPETAPDIAWLAPQLCGDYRSADLDASAQIERTNDALQMTVQGRHGRQVGRLQALSHEVMTFTPCDPLLAALGGSSVLNIERSAGRVVGLRLDSLRTRHIHFARQETHA